VPFFIKPITSRIANTVYTSFLNPNFKNHFDFLESQLASAPNNGGYLCGELSAADFLMIFPLEAASGRVPDYDKSRYPKIFAYVDKLHERGSYKKAVQRIVDETGSYDAAL
jgi:glutathione S-transferase